MADVVPVERTVKAPLPAGSIAAGTAIWFHPKPGPNDSGGTYGSVDFANLFDPQPWPITSSATSVFGLYAGWVTGATDQQLDAAVAFIKAHNMGIELEAPSLQATDSCGNNVEGYVPSSQTVHDFTLAYLQRLKALDAPVQFIKVDEPFFYGSVAPDANACRFPVAQTALEVSQYVQLVHTVYPNAAVGDVEPIVYGAYPTGPINALKQWFAAYRTISGANFPFYVADMDFMNPEWPLLAKTMEVYVKSIGMKYGIIYIGQLDDTSDAQWIGRVVSHFTTYQAESGGRPDFVLFQSWEPHPVYILPETNPMTFTGALLTYLHTTTRSVHPLR